MTPALCGAETEYGCAAFAADGTRVARGRAPRSVVDGIHRRWACVRDPWGHGVFTGNGGRLYVDAGGHPEYSTPECTDPWSLVRHIRAGHRILDTLGRDLCARDHRIDDVVLTWANVDLTSRETWGCHESYLVRGRLEPVWNAIVPHLVSRIVFTGAGGFDSLGYGASFMVSPRVAHLRTERSSESTTDRPIVHTKNETHGGSGVSRLHLVCGESVGSETANFLKIGTTALVVALADAGVESFAGIKPGNALRAMNTFARDPWLQTRARVGIRGVSALAMQRVILETVEGVLGHDALPPWAGDVCERWRAVLDALEQGQPAVDGVLDWAIKLALFRELAADSGLGWEGFRRWNMVIGAIEEELSRATGGTRLTPDLVEANAGCVERVLEESKRWLRAGGCHAEELPDAIELYWQLLEADARFGQLGTGIFEELDAAGALGHAQPGVGPIDDAVANPPAGGRAALRGRTIGKLAGSRGCMADWTFVQDTDRGLHLEFKDPFADHAQWESLRDRPTSDRELARLRRLSEALER